MRDAALAARDEALAERRAALDARDDAGSKLAAALAAQEGALAERDRAVAETDALPSRVLDEVSAPATERWQPASAIAAERDELSTTIERLRLERDDAVASRGAALVMRNAANAPPAYQREGSRLLHFLPALVVLVVAVIAALLLHVI